MIYSIIRNLIFIAVNQVVVIVVDITYF